MTTHAQITTPVTTAIITPAITPVSPPSLTVTPVPIEAEQTLSPVLVPAVDAATSEANPVVTASTDIAGGGCSIASTGQPDIVLTTLLVFSVVYIILMRIGTFRTLKSSLLVFVSSCLAAGPTVADVRTGLYLGIGTGASRLMPGIENAEVTERKYVDVTWQASLGYQLNRAIGVELEYADLGSTELRPVGSVAYQDFNISGLYHLTGSALSVAGKKFSIFGRLGVGTIRNQSDIQLERGSDVHWLAGAGVQIPVSERLSLRAEAVNYDADVQRAGLSLIYSLGRTPKPWKTWKKTWKTWTTWKAWTTAKTWTTWQVWTPCKARPQYLKLTLLSPVQLQQICQMKWP